jgi:hypothetical protein
VHELQDRITGAYHLAEEGTVEEVLIEGSRPKTGQPFGRTRGNKIDLTARHQEGSGEGRDPARPKAFADRKEDWVKCVPVDASFKEVPLVSTPFMQSPSISTAIARELQRSITMLELLVPRTCRPARPCTDELRTSVAPCFRVRSVDGPQRIGRAGVAGLGDLFTNGPLAQRNGLKTRGTSGIVALTPSPCIPLPEGEGDEGKNTSLNRGEFEPHEEF